MKKQITILIVFLSAYALMAQDSVTNCKKFTWGFYPCATYYNLNLTGINSKGWMSGRPGNNEIMLGIGVNYGNPATFYASADFSADILTNKDVSNSFDSYSDIHVSCHSYRLAVNGYYLVIDVKKLGVYINIGTSFEDIHIHSENYKPSGTADTITVFEDFNLRQNFLLNGGISVYFYDMKYGIATGAVALRAGYDWAPLSPSSYTWYQYNGNIRTLATPEVSFNGFYAGIVFNIWFVKGSD